MNRTNSEHLRIDFKCGCFTLLWVEGESAQGGTSCCPQHDRLGLGFHGMEGKTVSNVRPGRLLNGPTAKLDTDTRSGTKTPECARGEHERCNCEAWECWCQCHRGSS